MSQNPQTAIDTNAPPEAHLPKTASSAERARILLALIDKQGAQDGLSDLTQEAQALQQQDRDASDSTTAMPSRETLMRSARDLLARLEPRKKQIARSTAAPKPSSGMLTKTVVRSTIAALIEDSDLPKEHPAVIAIVLQNQDAKTKAAVLRQLPGSLARRVQQSIERVKEAT